MSRSPEPDAQRFASVSGHLARQVRAAYDRAFDGPPQPRRHVTRAGLLNLYALDALGCYVLCVATLEAYVNEVFLSDFASEVRSSLGLGQDLDWLEYQEVPVKAAVLTRILGGQQLDPGRQPWQDLGLLLRLRNELAHFKLKAKRPRVVSDLAQREIALPDFEQDVERGVGTAWTERVASTEGIRWALDTVRAVAVVLHKLVDPALAQGHARLRAALSLVNLGPIVPRAASAERSGA